VTGDDRPLLDRQRTYYDLRAPDYGDVSQPDRRGGAMLPQRLVSDTMRELAPSGAVLELACGAGAFTGELARRATSVTALDGSPTMLERNRQAIAQPNVAYVEADIFDWQPSRTYDFVFFGFWLSHVPPSRFEAFWSMIRSCLAPGGRAGLVDEDERGAVHDDVRVVDGTPVATRTLRDGQQHDIVKVFWRAADLERRLQDLGWKAAVRAFGESYLVGSAA
jgi:SAM-dependent methyltransferase